MYSRSMTEWLKSGAVEGVERTSFAPSTLLPVWNQTLKLYVTISVVIEESNSSSNIGSNFIQGFASFHLIFSSVCRV